jgi:hypothetical protein
LQRAFYPIKIFDVYTGIWTDYDEFSSPVILKHGDIIEIEGHKFTIEYVEQY